MISGRSCSWLLLASVLVTARSDAQQIQSLDVRTGRELTIAGYTGAGGRLHRLRQPLPVFTAWVNDTLVSSAGFSSWKEADSIRW